MKKLILVLGLLAMGACVPLAPAGPLGPVGPVVPVGPVYQQPGPEIYDLPAHCTYDRFGQVICA